MKTIIIVKLCVAFLLTIVPDGVRTRSITEVLKDMAAEGGIIKGVFRPIKSGSMGSSQLGIIYRGHFIPLRKEVAMKFTPIEHVNSSRKEYDMYTYLGAMKKRNAEAHGIPSIYYYGEWENHMMLAMKLIAPVPQPIYKSDEIAELDLLVVFREFVRIMKYIHSNGVVHKDATIENMMVRNGHGFIFNFGLSRDMNEGTPAQNIADAKGDFVVFLYSLFKLKSTWQWSGFTEADAFQVTDINSFRVRLARLAVAMFFEERAAGGRGLTGLKRVFDEFRKHALDNGSTAIEGYGNSIPFYDYLYQVINEEMGNCGGATSSDSSLPDLPNPFESNSWPRPKVIYESFEKKYIQWRSIGNMEP